MSAGGTSAYCRAFPFLSNCQGDFSFLSILVTGFGIDFRGVVVGGGCWIINQARRRFAYVELAHDDISDEAGAVFPEQPNFFVKLLNGGFDFTSLSLYLGQQ